MRLLACCAAVWLSFAMLTIAMLAILVMLVLCMMQYHCQLRLHVTGSC